MGSSKSTIGHLFFSLATPPPPLSSCSCLHPTTGVWVVGSLVRRTNIMSILYCTIISISHFSGKRKAFIQMLSFSITATRRCLTRTFNQTRHITATSQKPLRSVLYIPGTRESAIRKARTLEVDAIILDLEDAVAPSAKEEARRTVIEEVKKGGFGARTVSIRINGLDTPWGEKDLAAVADAAPDAVVVPKVSDPDDVLAVVDRLEAFEAIKRGQQPESAGATRVVDVWSMVETPRGIQRVDDIAAAASKSTISTEFWEEGGHRGRHAALVFGSSDLAKELHATHTGCRTPLLYSLSRVVLAAKAAGLAVLDGVYLRLDDADGFRQACQQGQEMGFDGKTLIHPKTIDVANEVFGPSPGELANAIKVIEAHRAAEANGVGVVVVDGHLIEKLHVEAAYRLLSKSEAIEKMKRHHE